MISLGAISSYNFDQMHKWRNSPEIYTWCRQFDLIDEVNHKIWFERQFTDPKIKMYSIYNYDPNLENNILVGICGLTDIDFVNARAEFSIYIGPNFSKRGFGEKALRLLLDKGFNNYRLKTIWGEVFDKNPALEMFKNVGFKEEGIRRDFYFRDGKFINAILISITKEEIKND